jgi:hypothetical protein
MIRLAARARIVTIVLLAAASLAAPARAQDARGTITGTVRDTSGAIVPGATVTVTNVAMGTEIPLVTNEAGIFQAPFLIPGTYRVRAELAGFRQAAREVELRIADRLAVDLELRRARPWRT